MLYTNEVEHGGHFEDVFLSQIQSTNKFRIASGYFSLDILQKYKENILEKARHNKCEILLGMAFYEGLSQKQFDLVSQINNLMRVMGTDSGFYVTNGRKYHGKIFQFDYKTYLGSSNFSNSGFKGNIEATIECNDDQKAKIDSFLDSLFSFKHSIKIEKAQIPIKGKVKLIGSKAEVTWEGLKRHKITHSSPEILLDKQIATYDLLALSDHNKSNLNIFFGKGRENKKTGIIIPRPWYEFEIIAKKDITSSPDYPKGSFTAYTDDGYIIPMKTSGDYNKNLRSEGGLQVFGKWFKTRLENAGVLEKFTPITAETLLEYGKTKLTLYRMKKENTYYMTFEN